MSASARCQLPVTLTSLCCAASLLLVLLSARCSYAHVHVDAIGGFAGGTSRARGLQQAYVPPFNPNVQPHCNGPENMQLPRCGRNRTAPFTRDSKVAIIGAGASGLTLAKLLKDRGYKNVHLLEKTGRAGGYPQTVSFQDVPHEYATCYTIGRYECVLRLMDDEFISTVPFPPGTDDQIRLGDISLSLNQYWFYFATTQLSPPKNYTTTAEGLAQFGQDLVEALVKYEQLYFYYMGSGQYLFPSPQPSADKLRALNMTFGQFLQDNDLTILAPYLYIAVTFQGYGHLTSVPALYGLMWFSPNFVDASIRVIQGLPETRPGTSGSMIREGFGTFFQRIANRIPNIRLNVNITKVTRTPSGVQITWSGPNAAGAHVVHKAEKFDFLVVTSRMPASLKFLDARPDELDIFGRLVNRFLDLSHVNVTGMPSRSPLLYQLTNASSLQPNLITMVRNDVAMLNTYLMPTPDAADIRTILTETTSATTEAQNKAAILAQMKSTWGADTAEFMRYGHYEYHSAFSASEIAQGYPWKIRALQGKYRTWYAGSYASFESVADVLDHNYQLINQELCV